MGHNSPIYRLYAPEHNPSILAQIVEKIRENWFPTRAIILGVSVEAPMMITPHQADEFGGMEHFKGFRSAITLMNSSIYTLQEDEGGNMMANNSLMQAMDFKLVQIGQQFLNTGYSLLIRDLSGKRLMSEIIKLLNVNFPNKDFQSGAKTAEDIFLAYWRKLEGMGLDLTDVRKP